MAAGPIGGAVGADDQAAACAWFAQEDRQALQVLPDEARPDRRDDRLEAQGTVRHPVSERAGNALSRNLDHSAQDPEAKGLRNYPRTPFLTPEPLENKRVTTVLGGFLASRLDSVRSTRLEPSEDVDTRLAPAERRHVGVETVFVRLASEVRPGDL